MNHLVTAGYPAVTTALSTTGQDNRHAIELGYSEDGCREPGPGDSTWCFTQSHRGFARGQAEYNASPCVSRSAEPSERRWQAGHQELQRAPEISSRFKLGDRVSQLACPEGGIGVADGKQSIDLLWGNRLL